MTLLCRGGSSFSVDDISLALFAPTLGFQTAIYHPLTIVQEELTHAEHGSGFFAETHDETHDETRAERFGKII